jgi:hypothetical protein
MTYLKTVDLVHGDALVVAAHEVHVVGIQQLQREKDEDNLQRKAATIHEVSVEQIRVLIGGHSCERRKRPLVCFHFVLGE